MAQDTQKISPQLEELMGAMSALRGSDQMFTDCARTVLSMAKLAELVGHKGDLKPQVISRLEEARSNLNYNVDGLIKAINATR